MPTAAARTMMALVGMLFKAHKNTAVSEPRARCVFSLLQTKSTTNTNEQTPHGIRYSWSNKTD